MGKQNKYLSLGTDNYYKMKLEVKSKQSKISFGDYSMNSSEKNQY